MTHHDLFIPQTHTLQAVKPIIKGAQLLHGKTLMMIKRKNTQTLILRKPLLGVIVIALSGGNNHGVRNKRRKKRLLRVANIKSLHFGNSGVTFIIIGHRFGQKLVNYLLQQSRIGRLSGEKTRSVTIINSESGIDVVRRRGSETRVVETRSERRRRGQRGERGSEGFVGGEVVVSGGGKHGGVGGRVDEVAKEEHVEGRRVSRR
ncbi:hypothetical protein Fmac_001390 [Flemingia macrophylla]|uniref:Uncharacterized protein n=1 Tax=Flemingia macrophylla TaxID=520843 RepID=A0ABD1NJS9_9FABA